MADPSRERRPATPGSLEPAESAEPTEAAEPADALTEPFRPLPEGGAPAVHAITPADLPPSLHVRLFGSHAYFRLWLAQVVSSLGDWIGFVAIVTIARRIGGGSPEAAISLVVSARFVPGFFLSQLAGVLVDRWNRKRVMVVCDISRGLVLATVPFIHSVWGLVIASLLLEIGTLLWSPAKEASVPNLVPTEHLTTVNSLSLVAAYGTFPVATLVFAALTKLAEFLGNYSALDFLNLNRESIAIYFDVLTFFVSAVMITTLPLVRRARRERSHNGRRIDFSQVFTELKEGWSFIFINPVVRAVMVSLGTGLIGGGMLVPLGEVFSEEVLGAGPAGFGLLLTALGFGVATGVLALSALQKRLPMAKVFTGSVLGAGACLIAAASMSTLSPAFVFVLGLGICAGSVYVLGFTILQVSVEDELRGRIFSSLYTLVRLCLLIALAVGPLLSGLLDTLSDSLLADRSIHPGFTVFLPGVRLALWLAGLIILGAGMLALQSLRAGSRTGRVRDL